MNPFIPDMEAEKATTLTVVLPWPDKRLSPNARVHWRPRAVVEAKAKEDARFQTLEVAGYSLGSIRADLAGDERIPVRITFYPPDKRHRDDDNAIASFKHARDGIADALKVNDRRFRPSYIFADPEKPGRVEVVIG